MADTDNPDLNMLHAAQHEAAQSSPHDGTDVRHGEAEQEQQQPAESDQRQFPADGQGETDDSNKGWTSPATPAQEAGSRPASGKNKRSRSGSKGDKKASMEQDDAVGDDFKLNVDAEWSDDEKEEKEHPAKRIAATPAAQDGGPVAVKKSSSALNDFTIRAVVTRKDVEVVFEHKEGKREELEEQTGASIAIIAGKDDPDIVVDRVLVIKGPIANVASAYLHIAEGMLAVKITPSKKAEKEAPSAADANADAGAAGAADADAAAAAAAAGKDADGGDSEHGEANADPETTVPGGAADTSPGAKADDSKPKDNTEKNSGSKITLRMLVPHKCVGSIMGHGGKTINHIRDTSSVNIHTSESTLPRSSERIVELVGTPPSIQKAIVLIAEALLKDIAAYASADFYVPAANLPSAMTVETHSRKRKDIKRHSHNDSQLDHRGHVPNSSSNNSHSNSHGGNRGGGYRNSFGGYNNSNNGNSSNRNYNRSGGGGGGSSSSNNRDRHDRYNRHNDRQGGRNRGNGNMSHVNRMPIGSSGSSNNNNQGPPNQLNYRVPNSSAGARPGGAPAMGYGYAMPAPAAYPGYASQAAGGSGMYNSNRYNGNMPGAAPAPAASPYGSGYNAAPSPYQFPAPASYGYAAAPVQNVYGGRPVQPSGGYQQQSRAYQPRGSRPQMPQAPAASGSSQPLSGGAPGQMSGQTIQQIYVPSDKIGAVIGRRGETINEIRRSTNARVDIQDSAQGAQQRLVIITGGYDEVRSAYYMIKNKIDTARPALRQ
ncbi:PAB1 binding protein [Dipsacomyces acuminosporus]|nr:PAB1 binding protein [Dipsacomyces acuminosporus]